MAHFYHHTDDGHGWLGVTYKDIATVGLRPDMFSPYSYVHGEVLYLEEDMDAGLFLKAYQATHGLAPEVIERHTRGDHLIRTYTRLRGGAYNFETTMNLMKGYDALIAARAA